MTGSPSIKKHGSDLLLSPQEITPVQQISNSSDRIFSEFNKKVVDNPFEIIRINGYDTARPWAAAAASSQISSSDQIEPFPTVDQLDNEFDSWPDSNPFTATNENMKDRKRKADESTLPDQSSHQNKSKDSETRQILSSNISKPFSFLLTSIIQSKHKLLFISHRLHNETRREWKLVQIDLQKSMNKRPTCLQDGIFYAIFYIQHPHDNDQHILNKRFWIEYHRRSGIKHISENYHIIQPSETSSENARLKGLVPYGEWIDLKSDIYLHGPFDFSILNNRQTRDRISESDWTVLHSMKSQYNNDPPNLLQHLHLHVNWSQSFFIENITDNSVLTRVSNFHTMLEAKNLDLNTYEG